MLICGLGLEKDKSLMTTRLYECKFILVNSNPTKALVRTSAEGLGDLLRFDSKGEEGKQAGAEDYWLVRPR